MELLALEEELLKAKAPEPPKYQSKATEKPAAILQSFPPEVVNLITKDFQFEDRYAATCQ